jgi:hypothetical protein
MKWTIVMLDKSHHENPAKDQRSRLVALVIIVNAVVVVLICILVLAGSVLGYEASSKISLCQKSKPLKRLELLKCLRNNIRITYSIIYFYFQSRCVQEVYKV